MSARRFYVYVYEARSSIATEQSVRDDYEDAMSWCALRLSHRECNYSRAVIETYDSDGRCLARDTIRLSIKRDPAR